MLKKVLNILKRAAVPMLVLSLLVLSAGQYCILKIERKEFGVRLGQMRDIAHMAGREAVVIKVMEFLDKACKGEQQIYVSPEGQAYYCTSKVL